MKTTVSSQKLEALKSLIDSAKQKIIETYPISRTDAADYSLDFLNALDKEFNALMNEANALQTQAEQPFETKKPEPAPPIYRLPCSLTGLDAGVDNCDPPAIIVEVEHADDPMSAGCVDRYITTDGHLIDCSIDFTDFAVWFDEELEEFEVEA